MAQLVAQLICNHQVAGSNPAAGSIFIEVLHILPASKPANFFCRFLRSKSALSLRHVAAIALLTCKRLPSLHSGSSSQAPCRIRQLAPFLSKCCTFCPHQSWAKFILPFFALCPISHNFIQLISNCLLDSGFSAYFCCKLFFVKKHDRPFLDFCKNGSIFTNEKQFFI